GQGHHPEGRAADHGHLRQEPAVDAVRRRRRRGRVGRRVGEGPLPGRRRDRVDVPPREEGCGCRGLVRGRTHRRRVAMRDILDTLLREWRAGSTVGLGTVVRTFKSAPQDPGAAMLVTAAGEAAGSVSGGCVEGAVYALAEDSIAGAPPTLERYGISDDDAFAVGLTCGGILDVFVE